jgi:2'-deoxynucleoside 5'-phosphate N-hydrolase
MRYRKGMQVYFGFSMAGDRSELLAARHIVEVLEELGHEVLTRHLVRDDAWEMDSQITAQQVYERDLAWLDECDVMVAEVSGSSFGIGYEAGYLLATGKRKAILFYREDAAGRISRLITGNCNPNCTLVPYAGTGELEAFLRANLGPVEGTREDGANGILSKIPL